MLYVSANEKAVSLNLHRYIVVESVSQREVTCRCLNDAAVPDTVKQLAVNFTRGAKKTLINACDEVGAVRFWFWFWFWGGGESLKLNPVDP
jgi:hypothetical protein